MDSGSAAQRRTARRAAVSEALERTQGFVSAATLYRSILDDGVGIGLATVYRQLNAMAASGEADTISAPASGGLLYRACTVDAHHHHLVCDACGLAVDVDPPDERWIDEVARAHGFAVTRHDLDIFGTCEDCAPMQR